MPKSHTHENSKVQNLKNQKQKLKKRIELKQTIQKIKRAEIQRKK